MKTAPRKTGRPTAHHRDRHGNKIEGLSRLSDGRWKFSAPGLKTIKITEADEDRAISLFRQWQEKHAAPELGAATIFRDVHVAAKAFGRRIKAAGEATITVSVDGKSQVVEDVTLTPAQWRWLRDQITDRPKWVAQMVGIEQIGYLRDIEKPTPSPTLAEVGKLYLEHAKITENWKAKSKGIWNEFVEAVGVSTLRDLTQEHLVDYGDEVLGAGNAPSYARNRFGAVKAIINYPTKRGKWALDCKRALAFCSVLVPPKKSAMDPKPIDPADFAALLKHSDTQMRAILLLALNCCMYGIEVASLDWDAVDLEKATLSTCRTKTKVVRIATLWPETVEALRAIPRKSDAIFYTAIGTKADSLCIWRLFKPVRKAAGLPKIQFSQIRDGAYTAAVEAGVDLNTCRLLAGHQTGIADHYVKRRPAMVAAACDAIRKAYAIAG